MDTNGEEEDKKKQQIPCHQYDAFITLNEIEKDGLHKTKKDRTKNICIF